MMYYLCIIKKIVCLDYSYVDVDVDVLVMQFTVRRFLKKEQYNV